MDRIELDALSDTLLVKIRRKRGHPFDPGRMAKNLKTNREELAVAVRHLKRLGYKIKIDKKGRITFSGAPDNFLPAEIANGLKTEMMGGRIYAYQSVQSTNLIAHKLAISELSEGTLVIAEHQTRGKGRLGRSWHSPPKVGLYCSLILKPRIHPTLAPGLSLLTAVALTETILSYGEIDVKIKWPNDVLVRGAKTAGILTELSAEIGRTNFVIVGIGVNINHRPGDFPKELKKHATSIRIGLKKTIGRVEFLQRFLLTFEKEYFDFKRSGMTRLRKKILQYSSLLGQKIELKMGRKTTSGIVIDIDETGHLVMDTKNGIQAFNAGEVSVR
ncbi:MAG: biotin--[acetyl-CoA-carboxylase] ligase [Candidatus Zixiibacteriota bacterium]|nr:MAG: biotin--[acetyl-CoA-carboxylase] ligase [candidate division Zixibacteria bacterium]